MKTKKPSAIVYGLEVKGELVLTSDVYFEEHLYDEVVIYSLPYKDSVIEDYTKYTPDLIISIDEAINIPHTQLSRKHKHLDEMPGYNILANIVVCQTVFKSCEVIRPRFSIFTPTYQTGERIRRTYEGLKNQVLTNWEWVVVDDSPDDDTWNILQEIASTDYRVKLNRIYPLTGGNIGLAKYRAAMLCEGDWLVELDHDDYLTSECLSTSNDASLTDPDAKFL